jgi:hypothetical protein
MVLSKLKYRFTLPKLFATVGLGLLVALSLVSPLKAADSPTVTQGYGSDIPIQTGMIVRLSKADPTKVTLLSLGDIEAMHGIVVNGNDAAVTLSSDERKVFVATIGRYEVLVNDQNGPIKAGDYITISSLSGIGMKSSQEQSVVLGKAISAFEGTGDTIGQTDVKTADGNTTKVSLGRIQVDIGVARNPQLRTVDRGVPEFLRKATEAIAQKTVSPLRIYISLGVLFVSALIAGSLLYAGIRSSIVAIGRNPLSRHSINRSLLQVVMTSLIVFISGLFGVYLLLKL